MFLPDSITVSLVVSIGTIVVAYITTRNKASKADVENLRSELRECKEQNSIERNDLAIKLKAALDEKNNLLNENWLLMRKLILRDTAPKIEPKIRKGRK